MRLSKFLTAFLATVMFLFTGPPLVMGDLVFSVEVDPPTNAGDTTAVTFSATSNVPGGQTLSGFVIPVDVAGGGDDNNGGIFTFGPSDVQSLVGGNASLNFAGFQNGVSGSDVLVNLTNASGIQVTTMTPLFDLFLTSDPGLGVGSFAIDISPTGLFEVTGQGGAVLTGSSSVLEVDGVQGSVNIVAAVPEPSSIAILIGAL